MQIIAKDELGNEFIKTVRRIKGTGFNEGSSIIDFGYSIQYVEDFLLRNYPFKTKLIIDICGKNHKGSEVSIDANTMNKIVEELILN